MSNSGTGGHTTHRGIACFVDLYAPRASSMPDNQTSPAPGRETRGAQAWFWLTISIVAVLSGILRVACSENDLWLDEIWSLALSKQLSSPWAVLRAINDNNHPLNTVFLYFAGDPDSAWVCRSFSIVTGTISVMLGGLVARAHFKTAFGDRGDGANNITGVVGAFLIGISYIFVLYSSEARGYASLVFFSLLALYALDRGLLRSSVWFAVYWAACVLALLSHPEAYEVIIAGLCFTFIHSPTKVSLRDRLLKVALWHAVPIIVSVAYYILFVGRLKIGGGPTSDFIHTIAQVAMYTFGIPSPVSDVTGVTLLFFVVLLGLAVLRSRTNGVWLLYILGVLGGVILQFFRPERVQLFPRYFLINALFLILLAAILIGKVWCSNPRLRVYLAAMLAGSSCVNASFALELLKFGRGEYGKAVEFIGRSSVKSEISIGTDHNFRNLALLDFYAKRLRPGQRFRYYPAGVADIDGPQWLLLHRLDGFITPSPTQPGPLGSQYIYVARFRHAPLSGWDWILYRNTNLTDAPSDTP